MKKKFFALMMSVLVFLSLCCVPIYAADATASESSIDISNGNMYDYYQDYVNYSTTRNPNIELMTYDQFVELYEAQNSDSVDDYIAYLKSTIDVYSTSEVAPYSSSSSSSSSSGSGTIGMILVKSFRKTFLWQI